MSMWRKKAQGGEVPEPVKSDTVLGVLHPGRWDTQFATDKVVLPKRGTTEQLADLNWYLEDGQPVFDYTRGVMRIGPGHWNDLPDFTGSENDPFRQPTFIPDPPRRHWLNR